MNEDSRPTDAGGRRNLPGVAKPSRFRPRFHYELLVCGLRGHELVGTDAKTLRPIDAIIAREIDGVRWHRCLRCDSWLPIPPAPTPIREHPPEQDEIELPLRGRPLRDKIVLRAIAVDRAVHFVILSALAVAVFLIATDQVDLRDRFYAVLSAFHGGLGGPTDGSDGGIARRIGDLLSQPNGRLHLIGIVLAVYAVLEGVEAVGLWMQKRWAEYLTLIATAGLLPLELYELYERVTVLKIVALIVNLAVVAYLLYAKRLFGIRGGAAAEEALRERDMGWRSLTASSPEAYRQAYRQPSGGGDRVARVYVIELDRGAGRRRDARLPWVYVGSSARDPEIRFRQHLRGYRSSGLVKRFALHLRPDLYDDLPAFKGAERARQAELERARDLADCGFIAHSDGTSYGKGSVVWREWDAERLSLAGEHVDESARELLDSTFEAPEPIRCAELLHGDRGFWVADYIDPADPPPAYGRFAHVMVSALEERVASAIS